MLEAWQREPHVVENAGEDGPFDWQGEVPRAVAWRRIWIGEADGRPVGVVVVIDPHEEETHYWGEVESGLRAIDIWLGDAADLGRGYGGAMMRQAIEGCLAEGAHAILIDPLMRNVRAQRFYARLGFRPVGPRRFGADDCLVMRLDAEDWKGV